MKLRIIQKDVNNRAIENYLKEAQADQIELICFGELATSGCLYEEREVEPLEFWTNIFSKYDMYIMCGLPIVENDIYTNSYIYYHNGNVQRYNKINLFPPMNEDKVYNAGTELTSFKTPYGVFGVAICYDIRFPDHFVKLKELNPDYIIIPAAFPLIRITDWKELLAERAKETGATVIGINAVGDDGTNTFGGSSMVVKPSGEIIAEAGETIPAVLDVSLNVLVKK